MEKPASRTGPQASRQSRMRRQPFKHCAASARRRSWRFSSFATRNFLYNRFEARISAQRIEERIGFDELKVGGARVTYSLFQPVQRPVFISKSEIGQGKCVRLHIARSGSVSELSEQLAGFILMSHGGFRMSNKGKASWIV